MVFECHVTSFSTSFSINLPHSVNYQSVGYSYDDASVKLSKGRLTSVYTLAGNYRLSTDLSTTNYLGYDELGRVTASSQTTAGHTYVFPNYSYNLADSLTGVSYPSGRVVQTCYDGANRVSQVGGKSCSSAVGAYASNFAYAPHGAPTQYAMGNGVWHEPSYSARLHMTGLTVVNNATATQLMNATWDYGGFDNGNVRTATYNGGGFASSQTFTYDGANRLQTATEAGGWSRSFGYDPYGNMTPSGNPAPPTVSFNGNNQIATQSYDQTGNQLTVNGNMLTYDPENHVATEVDGITGGVETYVYDGDGRRVEKYGPSGTPQTIFVYDARGELAAEYSTVANTSRCVTCYLSPDYLGTTRLVTDGSGNLIGRHDYLPFGEELQANTFGRGAQWGPGNDGVNQKFTGKERDSETQLDYFGARYYGSALGRFTSPDEPLVDQDEQDPQSWNLYGYVRNNPLRYADPTGHNCVTFDNGSTGDDGQGTACAGSQTAQVTNVTAQGGNKVTAFAINLGFALDSIASSYFSFIAPGSQTLSITPTNKEFTGQLATGVALVGTALIGPEGEAAQGASRLWSRGVKNAFQHWLKHGKEFPNLQNAKQYVEAAQEFVTNPPTGTLTKLRANGDTVLYNSSTNTFAVKTADGVPRTMFKPNDGLTYFNAQ